MSITINARGTSIPFFTVGKQGITIYQGSADPSLTYTINNGDMWFNNSLRAISSWNSSSTAWTSVANGIFKMPLADGSNGQVIATNAAGQLGFVDRVSTVSVVSTNGLSGTVNNATTTPAITLSTTVTGLIKGSSGSFVTATSGTDYSVGTSALVTGILKSTTTTGALTIAIASDFPILNQNTTGTAANVTGTVALANGGTGATTAPNALTNLGGTTTGTALFTSASAAAAATTIGLGNVTNTSDANKPVSTAQQTALNLKANIASPTFTGVPAAPTPLSSDNSTTIATTAFVTTAVAGVSSIYAPIASPTFTGVPAAPTATAGTNTTQIATTAFVTTAASGFAPLASPTFTGIPAAPTATAGTSTTQLATTAFATTADNLKANIASPTFTGTVTIPTGASIAGFALLASPTFTGTPSAPTATAGTSTTQLATTAFATTADNLKANIASPTFTGTPSAPTATAGTNTTQIATTAFVAVSYAPLASPTFTGTPVAPTATAGTNTTQIATTAFVATANAANAAGTIPISSKTSGYTFALIDAGFDIQLNSTSNATFTVPLNSSVAFVIGTTIFTTQISTGFITIAPTAGVTLNATGGLISTGIYTSMTLRKIATDTWIVYGGGVL